MMLRQITSMIVVLATVGISATDVSASPNRWESMGVASTGEKVYLNLDSIGMDQRRSGYFFIYQIGNDRPLAFTPCDGRFQVADSNVVFGEFMTPQSEAVRKMLGRVCTYRDR